MFFFFIYIIESAASNSDPSGCIMCKVENIKNHRENQTQQSNQRGQTQKSSKSIEHNKQQHFYTYVAQTGHRSNAFLFYFLFSFGFLDAFLKFCFDLFGSFVLFGFPYGVDILNRVQGQTRYETDPSPHLLVAPSTFSNEGPHKPTRNYDFTWECMVIYVMLRHVYV